MCVCVVLCCLCVRVCVCVCVCEGVDHAEGRGHDVGGGIISNSLSVNTGCSYTLAPPSRAVTVGQTGLSTWNLKNI